MKQIFLSYARADGKDPAAKLRRELEQSGFKIWQDTTDMRGGQAWKDQLRQAIKAVDTVLVLLTPGAVASKYVNWEWETAITVEKKVIPLLILPCEVPKELNDLHYHNLSTDQNYTLGFASLIRDLNQAEISKSVEKPNDLPAKTSDSSSRNISIGGSVTGANIVTGDSNVVGNNNTIRR